MELTKRIDLNVGFMCNINCKFCYYFNSHNKKIPSFEKLKSELRLARKFGMESVEFTGGEPTMREDIFKVVAYAKQLGFKRMCMITNGIAFKDKEIVKAAKEAGIEEIKFSIHGAEEKVHDAVIGKHGFGQLMQGMRNTKKIKLNIKTNTVINRFNYKTLPQLSKFLIRMKPEKVDFELINPVLDAKSLGKKIMISYSEIIPYLHKALNLLEMKGYTPTVRYIPFCFMKGYEKYVCNLCQVQYDPDEWDYLVKNRIKYGFMFSKLNQLLGYANMIKRMYVLKKDVAHRAVIESKLLRFTTKGKVCKECKYDFICDGLWKSYTRLYGYSELKPSTGKKIKDTLYFIKALK